MSQKEELEETISDLHNTISNSKSSEEDINQLQSKILELQDVNTAQSENVNHMIKLETIPEPSSEVNDDSIVKQEGLLSKKDKKKLNTSGKLLASLKGDAVICSCVTNQITLSWGRTVNN